MDVSEKCEGSCQMKHSRICVSILLLIGLTAHEASSVSAGLPLANQASAEKREKLSEFFKTYVGLSDDQIRYIRSGKALAKTMDSPTADEVFVFGAVYVRATPEQYLKLASNIDALKKLPNYLAIRKFSDPPQISDLDGFSLEEDDVKALQKCREGKCEVQLPTNAMDEFRTKVNWSAPDATDQANQIAKELVLEALKRYQEGGNAELGIYRDKNDPAAVDHAFQSLVSRAKAMPTYLPELQNYLLKYPKAKSEHIQSEFYWEKVNFGLKPTIRLLQAVLYRGVDSGGPEYALAVKQLYASHYFHTALDLTICIRDDDDKQPGMFLVTLKGSEQAGLTGLKGGLVRKVAVDKTRSSLERALAAMKVALETRTN
jgi:hypothetical protein